MRTAREVDFAIGTRTLHFEPTNLSLEELVGRLSNYETVRVMLEPGDMTRYIFFIIPLVGHNAPIGVPPTEEWLGYVFENTVGRGLVCIRPWEITYHDFMGHATSEYTARVMAAFHNVLAEAMGT